MDSLSDDLSVPSESSLPPMAGKDDIQGPGGGSDSHGDKAEEARDSGDAGGASEEGEDLERRSNAASSQGAAEEGSQHAADSAFHEGDGDDFVGGDDGDGGESVGGGIADGDRDGGGDGDGVEGGGDAGDGDDHSDAEPFPAPPACGPGGSA